MAEIALTEAWRRIDADLSLAAGNYRLQVSGIVQLALGSSAPTDDSDALTYFGRPASNSVTRRRSRSRLRPGTQTDYGRAQSAARSPRPS